MISDIIAAADKYATGLKHVAERRAQWLEKHKEVAARLREIAAELNEKAAYKQEFYVDVLHAFNEEINGTCADVPSVLLRTGSMPMHMNFRDRLGEQKEYMEEGMSVTFMPTVTGQLVVILMPHTNSLNTAKPEPTSLAIVENISQLNTEKIDQLITRGLQDAFHSSFTGIAEPVSDASKSAKTYQYTPIGFTRYETTEKVK